MGLSNRDYYRDTTSRDPVWLGECPAVKWLIIITGVAFVLQLVLTHSELPPGFRAFRDSYMDDWFRLDPDAVAQGQVWRLLSYAFLHDRNDPLHILFNMLALWWAGRVIEPLYGSREFTWYYLTAAFLGGIGFTLWGWSMGLPNGAVGASGATMAVMMLFACHFPKEKIYLFGIIGIEAQWLVGLYAFFDMYPVLSALGGNPRSDQIAHIIHLSGIAFGWVYFTNQWRLSALWDQISGRASFRWKWATRGRNLRVYQPEVEPADLDAEVDRILAKITAQGTESLTDRERAVLTRASERYKRRE